MESTFTQDEVHAFLAGAVDEFLSAIQSGDSAIIAFEKRLALFTESVRDIDGSLSTDVGSCIQGISDSLIAMNLASMSLKDVEETVATQLQEPLISVPSSQSPHAAAHQWLLSNLWYPYPTQRELRELSKASGLSVATLKSWFSQARTQIGWSALRMTRYGGSKTKICEAAAVYAEQGCLTSPHALEFLRIEQAAQKIFSPEEERQSKLLDFFEDCVLPLDRTLAAQVQDEKARSKAVGKVHLRKAQELLKTQRSDLQLHGTHSAYRHPGTGRFNPAPEPLPHRKMSVESNDFIDPDDIPTISVLGRRSLNDDDDNDEGPTRKRSRTTPAPKCFSRPPSSSRRRRLDQRQVSRQASPADTLVGAPSPAATLIGTPEPPSPLALEKDQVPEPISKKRRLSESDSHGFPKRHCIGYGIVAGPRLQAVSSPHASSKFHQEKSLVPSIAPAPSASKTISFRFNGLSASHIPNIFTPAHFDLQKASLWNFSCAPSFSADSQACIGNVAALDRKPQTSDDSLWAEADRKLAGLDEQVDLESDSEAVVSTPASSWSTATSDDESEVTTDVESTPRQERFPTISTPTLITAGRKRVARPQVTIVSTEPNVPETNSPVHFVSNEDNLAPALAISKYPPPLSWASPTFGPTSGKTALALS
ncbi:hypothetical protein DL96DRAFT_1702467 [Flagelloscypha sp. PMI_526]|nr:hypothetical protein DL96DRAFT_1702467 [Flagelloscypha sp. PMI_526]